MKDDKFSLSFHTEKFILYINQSLFHTHDNLRRITNQTRRRVFYYIYFEDALLTFKLKKFSFVIFIRVPKHNFLFKHDFLSNVTY